MMVSPGPAREGGKTCCHQAHGFGEADLVELRLVLGEGHELFGGGLALEVFLFVADQLGQFAPISNLCRRRLP